MPGFQQLNYGSSDFDARHRLAATYIYTVPAVGFLRDNLIARRVAVGLGDWRRDGGAGQGSR